MQQRAHNRPILVPNPDKKRNELLAEPFPLLYRTGINKMGAPPPVTDTQRDLDDPRSAIHKVFWTGGWDSTFRVLDLVLCRHQTVTPYYVRDATRQSTPQEFATMQQLRTAINERAQGGALLNTRTFDASDARPVPELREKFTSLKISREIGDQYLWLAELAQQHALEGIEVCVQHNEEFFFLDPRLTDSRYAYGLEPVRPALDETAPESLFNLFSFPTLPIGKAEMREYAHEQGFLDLLEQTWFCHLPTRSGQPCGFCIPCRMTASKGIGYRLPWRARLNNQVIRLLEALPRGYRVRCWAKRKLRGY